jgi:hypothetical protein
MSLALSLTLWWQQGRSAQTLHLPLRPLSHNASPTSCAIRGAKTRTIGSFKSNQCAPRPVFLRVCRHVTSKQHFRSKKIAPRSWWSCSAATASGSPAARAGDMGAHPTPTLDPFRAISAGGCLLVSTVALCGAKLNSRLTPLGPVVLSGLKALEEGQRSQPRCRSGSPATEPSSPGAKPPPPGPHPVTQPVLAPPCTQTRGGERWPIPHTAAPGSSDR